MRALLLPVQRSLQDQFCKFTAIAARLYVQVKMLVYAQQVRAQRVGANIQVLRALQRKAGSWGGRLRYIQIKLRPREAGSVVIHIQNLNLHPVQLQGVFYHHLQVKRARRTLLAQLLPIDSFIDKQNPVLQVHLHILLFGTRHYPEPARGEFVQIQPQVLRNVSNKSSVLQLLWDGVSDLPISTHW
uniref:Uncharacterized protein n=1 Tax=Oryzias melastigma TaxID=30732 RepID=A0A3B3BKX0_ORYME